MKKIICALAALNLIILSLASCSFGGKKTALTISGTDIDSEIYAYYLDRVEQRPEDYGLNSEYKQSEARDAAVDLCVRYLAFNTYFAENGLSLSVSEKVSVSDNVNNFWMRSGNHFEKIGVSKQTLTKILTSEAYENAIFSYLYDKGTGDMEAEESIKVYFYGNYVAFRNICAYYTTDDGSGRITEQERLALVDTFNAIAAASGTDSDSFTTACSDAGYAASDIAVLEKSNEGYPAGFFDNVNGMQFNEVKVFEYSDSIFAVRKESLVELGEGLYSSYRDTCIKNMHADEWSAFVEDYISTFTVDAKNV